MTVLTPADTQAEYAQAEADFAHDRTHLADLIVRNKVRYYRFEIPDRWHPTLDQRCPLCDGLFPKSGECYEIRMPKSLGGECKPTHWGCFLGAVAWTS